MLCVTFQDSSLVADVKNKHSIADGVTIRKDRTKHERYLYKKAALDLKEKIKSGMKNLKINYVNNVPTVVNDMDTANISSGPFNSSSFTITNVPKNSTNSPTF